MVENTLWSPMEHKGLPKYLSIVFHRYFEHAIWTFCELGIADLMAEYQLPISALELSQRNENNWNAEFLYRLLRVIADADIVTEVKNEDDQSERTIRFQLTDDGLLLTSDHFTKSRDMIRMELCSTTEKASAFLPSLIKNGYKNGNGFEQAFGCNLFDYMKKEENREYANLFNNSMITYSIHLTASIVSVIDFTRFNILVDIAGGLGTLLASVLEENPKLHGILFDLEHVIENAKASDPNEFERKQIESNRFEFVAGDMFKSETIPQADAYILKFIIHDWSDEKAIEILQSIRNANKNQVGKTISVFIIESIILSNDKDNWISHVMDFKMISTLGSKERTLTEHINLLSKSGYALKQIYNQHGGIPMIEAVTSI